MRHKTLAVALIATLAMKTGGAFAQQADTIPAQLEEVGVTEHLDAQLPFDLEFVDENGQTVTLGSYFDGEHPVILSLNYYRCPMLCGLQLNGLVAGLEEFAWTPGDQFRIVTVSINPLETPELAQAKKTNYLRRYDRPEAAQGWSFLTGREPAIKKLASTVGFGYRYDPEQDEYAHPAALYVCTPDGRIARYLYGIEYPPKRLRLSLLEATEGTIGSPFDQVILYCYHYDPSNRRYAPVAMNIMRLGGGLTASILGTSLVLLWFRDSRRARPSRSKN